MRRNKIISLVVFVITLFLLSSCFKQESYTFLEGDYVYSKQKFQFYDDVYIEEIIMNFDEIDKTEYEELNEINSIQNRKDKKYYKVLISINFCDIGLKQYSFKYMGKPNDRVDCYCIDIEIDNELFQSVTTVSATLEISSRNFNQSSTEQTDTGANIIDIMFDKIDYELNAEYDSNGVNMLLCSKTIRLNYKEEKKE